MVSCGIEAAEENRVHITVSRQLYILGKYSFTEEELASLLSSALPKDMVLPSNWIHYLYKETNEMTGDFIFSIPFSILKPKLPSTEKLLFSLR